MTEQQLLTELDNVNALKVKRLRLASLILKDTSSVASLVKVVFRVEEKVSIKAAWVLELVVKENFDIIRNHIDFLSKNSQKANYGGAVRSLAKITQIITQKNDKKSFLNNEQEELFIENAFDWLISNHKVAIKAYAMQILFRLGRRHDWVHAELKNILLENSYKYSSAYKSRARITIDQINHFQEKRLKK